MSISDARKLRSILKVAWYVALLALGIVSTASALADPLSVQRQAPPRTDLVADFRNAIFWTAVVILLVVNGLLVQSLARYRHKSAEKLLRNQHIQSSTILEIIWMFIPLGIMVMLLVLTIRSM